MLSKIEERKLHAERLLNDPMLQEAFKTVKETYTESMIATKPSDAESREILYRCIKVVEHVENHLKRFIADAKLSAQTVKRDIKRFTK